MHGCECWWVRGERVWVCVCGERVCVVSVGVCMGVSVGVYVVWVCVCGERVCVW